MATNKEGKEEWLPQNRETEGTRTKAIGRKAIPAKNKARLNTQQESKSRRGENKIDIAKKKLLKLGTDGQFDLRTKNDKKASSGIRVRPACCEARHCFKCRKDEKESIVKNGVVTEARERPSSAAVAAAAAAVP